MLLSSNTTELHSNRAKRVECVEPAPAFAPATPFESAGSRSHSIRFASSNVKMQ